jgi:hypothetical protein
MSWSDVGRILDPAGLELAPHEIALAQDVRAFMEKRKVLSMFPGFDPADYQRVVDATVLASERLHPQMAQLADELREHFDRRGWTWRNGSGGKSFGWWGPTDWRRPERWGRTYMALLWWPSDWPPHPERYHGLVGVVLSFIEPKIDVAMSLSFAPGVADELASHLNRLNAQAEVGFFPGSDWADSTASIGASAVDGPWLSEHASHDRFRVRRRLDVATVSSAGDLATRLETFVQELEAAGITDFIRAHAGVDEEPPI